MLILSRKPGQGIRIGSHIVITVKEVRGRQVRIGIDAPNDIPVYREEIYEAIEEANKESMTPDTATDQVLDLLYQDDSGEEFINGDSKEES
jgi:carbon storage regulator